MTDTSSSVVRQKPTMEAAIDLRPAFNEQTSTFTKSDTRHVDASYKYVLNNLAMLHAADGRKDHQ